MSPFQTDDPGEITRQIQDAIASNSSLREGLDDDAATPLVEWGARQAATVGTRLLQRSTAPLDEDAIKSTAYALTRLMTRITWVVTYRETKDAAWLTRTFNKINQLSQEVYGADAPTLSDHEIATWIDTHHEQDNTALIQQLIARLTPEDQTVGAANIETPSEAADSAAEVSATDVSPSVNETPNETVPMPPPSSLFGGARLPRRETKPPAKPLGKLRDLFQHTPDTDPPASPGGNTEHDE